MNYQKNSLKKAVVVGTILVSSAFVFQVSAQTWANPACAPTGCNTPTPINVSGTAQTKAGNFILGGRMEVKNTAPQLWLNENDQTSASLGLWRFLGWEGNIHLYRNLSATKDFATQSRVISILGANNNIGLGVVPTTKLDVDGQVKIRGGAPGLNKILASDADGLASWKTKEEVGIVEGTTGPWTISGINIFNNNTGNVGIGSNNNPTSLLTVQGNSTKLSEVKIIGTNDTVNNSIGLNVDSARNAHVILDRGNTGQTSYVRHATGGTTDWYAGINARQNSDYQISDTFNGEVGQFTIKKSNGNVGVGTNNPTTKLHVAGGGFFTGNLDVANNLNVYDGDVLIGEAPYGPPTATNPRLEVNGDIRFRTGTPAVNKILASTDASGSATWKTPAEIGIGSGSNWTVTNNDLTNKNTGNVGIGVINNVPLTKFHVLGTTLLSGNTAIVGNAEITGTTDIWDTLRIRGGAPAANKILASTNSSGNATWKTPSELGLNGSWTSPDINNNISNTNTGNVGVGITSPFSKLGVKSASNGESALSAFNSLDTSIFNVYVTDDGRAHVGINTGRGVDPEIALNVDGRVKIDDGTAGTGKVLTATNNIGAASWELPPFPRISTETFLKSDGVNSNFVTALTYDSKNPTTMSRPSYRVEENDVHLFFPPSWSNLDYGVMTCPADTIVISGGVTCDSDRAIKVNTIYPYYNGGVPNEWMVSCGNELSFIHSMHITCMSVD